jgi:hypothetical protein
MDNLKVAWKTLGAWIALAIAQMIAGMLVPITAPHLPNMFVWLLASDLVVAGVLAMVAMNSHWHGWRLALTLSGIPFVIGIVNVVEGAVFLGHSGIDWKRIALNTVIVWALLIPLWTLLFGRRAGVIPVHESPLKNRSWWEKVWRFVLSDFAYIFTYFLAGMIIFPYVKDYYDTQTVPSVGKIIILQLVLRGPVFVGICLLLMQLLGLPRATGALAVGLAFTMLNGVAPLIMPNPYFPDTVRWVHFCEVTSSNFVFGALVGWIWGKPRAVTDSPT